MTITRDLVYELFCQRQDILAQWQKRFRYILVDEFQDINGLQYQILRMLAKPEDNLFIVGDDDQSIYRFRGAKPEIMRRFKKDYPQAETVVLDENFRCSGKIVEAAGRVIAENKNRFEKKIHCGSEPGEPVEIRRFAGQEQEAHYLIKCIRDRIKQGYSYDSMAVLTRTNVGGRYTAEKLMEFQIPFRMRDVMPNLYDHWIARDLLAYIRLGMGIRDRKDFLQIMNRPNRYISRSCVEEPQISFERLRTWYEDKPWVVRRLDDMEEQIHRLGRMSPFAAVNFIRYGMEYEGYLKEYARYHKIREEELLEVADELQESAKNFKTHLQWFAHMEEYKRTLEEKKMQDTEEDAVTLSTLHGSKGLEFDQVFILDVNEDTIPHRKAVLEADIEEERRLFYVGMTRARHRLHLFYLKERYGKTSGTIPVSGSVRSSGGIKKSPALLGRGLFFFFVNQIVVFLIIQPLVKSIGRGFILIVVLNIFQRRLPVLLGETVEINLPSSFSPFSFRGSRASILSSGSGVDGQNSAFYAGAVIQIQGDGSAAPHRQRYIRNRRRSSRRCKNCCRSSSYTSHYHKFQGRKQE